MNYIQYRDITPLKYMLMEEAFIDLSPWGIVPKETIRFNQYQLFDNGTLHIEAYYVWNGASGPTVDTPDSIWPSCVHDVLCEMIQLGALPTKLVNRINESFHDICRACGMNDFRADYWKLGVDIGVPIICKPSKNAVEYEVLYAQREI